MSGNAPRSRWGRPATLRHRQHQVFKHEAENLGPDRDVGLAPPVRAVGEPELDQRRLDRQGVNRRPAGFELEPVGRDSHLVTPIVLPVRALKGEMKRLKRLDLETGVVRGQRALVSFMNVNRGRVASAGARLQHSERLIRRAVQVRIDLAADTLPSANS